MSESGPAATAGPRHELVRTSRDPITYDLVSDGVVTVQAVVSGRLLLDGAALQPVDAPGPWTLKASRRVAPSAWVLTAPDGSEHARCTVARRRRGAATLELTDGPDELRLDPPDRPALDWIKAAALADSGRFELRRGVEVLGRTGRDTSGVGPRLRSLRGAVPRTVELLRLERGASWHPDPVLACALLLFRVHVVTEFRTP